MDMSSILRRVNKLLAMAKDGRGDANEAAAAAAQAENIMRKFNIEHADLLAAEIKAGGAKFAKVQVSANMKRDDPSRPRLKRNPPWAGWLAIRVARCNDCDVRYGWNHDKGAIVEFCGFESDATVAGWMFEYLVQEMITGCKTYQRTITRTKAESDSFRKGFVLAMCSKLSKLQTEKDAEMQQAVSSRALVVSKTQAIAEHFGEFKYGESRTVTSSVSSAYHAGSAAGSKVDVGRRGVGHSASAVGSKRLAG